MLLQSRFCFLTLITAILFQPTFAQPIMLHTYNDLYAALYAGKRVSAYVNLNQCKVDQPKLAPTELHLKFKFNAFQRYPVSLQGKERNAIVTVNRRTIEDNKRGTVSLISRLRVIDFGSSIDVQIKMRELKKHSPQLTLNYACSLFDGQQGGVYFHTH